MALSVGIVALNTPKASEEYSTVEAADYTPSNRKITFDSDGTAHATFSVNDNTLDTRGWLLCLFETKPEFDPVTHKIEGSDRLHPYSTAACKHYFFAANTTKEGNISVTWNANFADQKEEGCWNTIETIGAAGHTLADYLNESTDWYIVVAIRHYRTGWATHNDYPGGGTNGWWENADYYAGRESNIRSNYPYGEIYFDLTELSAWTTDGAKLAVKFKSGTNEAYSDFAVSVPLQSNIYIASYELDFVPTNMIGCRFSSDSTTPSSGTIWNKTQELSFYRYGVIGVTEWGGQGYDDKGWSDGLATAVVDRVSGGTEEIILDNYKRNSDHKSEHYNDYIDLKENDEFVISYHSNSYHNWDCLPIFANNFSYDSDTQKIKVKVGGTYSFYFKAYEIEGKPLKSFEVFISKPEVAFADAWAQSFLTGDCESSKTNWSTYQSEYNNLPHSAKTFLLNVDHEPDPTVVFENYFAQAIQRYDYIIYLYGTSTYTDYIGRVNAEKVTPRTSSPLIGVFSGDNSTPIALVVIISVVSLTAVGGYIFLKRRKEN